MTRFQANTEKRKAVLSVVILGRRVLNSAKSLLSPTPSVTR